MIEQIKTLLNKYFEGETSLQEEKQLHAYFNSENVDASLREYVPLFVYFKQTSDEKYPNKTFHTPFAKKRSLFQKIAIVATFLSVTFGVSYYLNQQKQQKEAQIVFNQVKEALQMISMNYNKGAEKVKYLKEFDQTTSKIVNLEELK